MKNLIQLALGVGLFVPMLVQGCFCSAGEATTRSEIDTTYVIQPPVIYAESLPATVIGPSHPIAGFGWRYVVPPDTAASILFHSTKIRGAKELTAVYHPKDSTLSLIAVPSDTSVTRSHTSETVVQTPAWNFLFRPFGIVAVVLVLLGFVYFIVRIFVPSSGGIGTFFGMFGRKK